MFVVDLERKEWFNVAKGLLTPAFWRSQCTAQQGDETRPRPSLACVMPFRESPKAAPLHAGHGRPGSPVRTHTAVGCVRC